MSHATAQQRPAAWANWYGNVRCTPRRVERPADEGDVRRAVREAARAGLTVRPAGAGHSNVPLVATDGVVLDLSALRGVTAVDRERHLVTVLPGTTIGELAAALWEHGLSLHNQGDIDTQQVAGAVATGTHGTGVTLGSLSGALVGARLVTADGDVLELDAGDPALLRAARTSLGALGAMTSLTLSVTDAHALEARLEPTDWDDLHARWDALLAGHRHFAFYWAPAEVPAWYLRTDAPIPSDGVVLRTLDPLPPDASPHGERGPGPFVDRAHRVFSDVYRPDFHELEHMVALQDARAAVGALRELLLERHPALPFPIEVRFVAADDAQLSPFAGRASCSISISGPIGADNDALFDDCERTLAAFDARPHWGKQHRLTAERLHRLYPGLADFRAVRERLDPAGAFLNDHLRPLLTDRSPGEP